MKGILLIMAATTVIIMATAGDGWAQTWDCGATAGTVTCVLDEDGTFTVSGMGNMKDVTLTEHPWYDLRDAVRSVVVNEGVTSIARYILGNADNVMSVTIPSSVNIIWLPLFGNCISLMSYDVATNNTKYCSVDGVLFNKSQNSLIRYPQGKNSLSYTIPSSVTSIEQGAFNASRGLTSITIPNGVTDIRTGAFAYSGLTSIMIPSGVTRIESRTFQGCAGLTSIAIPNSVTSIGASAFYETGLTSITIPSGVTSIEEGAFNGCYDLTSISIPASVISIGSHAFARTGLRSMISLNPVPPTNSGLITGNNVDNTNICLYVPQTSINAYRLSNGWKDFTNINAIENGYNDLATLLVSGHALSPAFSPCVKNYTLPAVANNVSSLTITATPLFAGDIVTGTGTIPLSVGENILEITVRDPLSSSTTTYTITVIRQAALYTVTFNANYTGGTITPATATTGTDGRLTSLPSPTRTGYTFVGWFNTSAATGGTQITTSTVFTANTTIYARWTALPTYTVTFNANYTGGTITPSTATTGTDGRLTSLPSPTRPGYTFIGWFNISATTGGTQITTSTVFTANTTIHARWSALPTYTITFNANYTGGTITPATATTATNGTLASLPAPTRTGYTFAGWFNTSATTGGTQITTSTVFAANTTIYARWTALPTYTITFNANYTGGTITPATATTGTDGRLASLPSPTRPGYTFVGWFNTSAATGGTQITTSSIFTTNSTIYARWTITPPDIIPVTVTVTPNQTKVYGDPDPLTFTYTSSVVGVAFTGAPVRQQGENAGVYAINQGTLAAVGNYAITFVGANFTIMPRPVTVSVNHYQYKVSGDPDPPLFAYTSNPSGVFFSGALSREPGEAVGYYAITQGTLAAGSNYTVNFVGADFEIRPVGAVVTPVTVTVISDQGKVYGDPDPSAFLYISSVPDVPFTGALSRELGENAGTYFINQGTLSAGSDYAITFVGAYFEVVPRVINVTANTGYKVIGDADPVLTYVVSPPLVGGDAFTGALVREAGEAVGMYAIRLGTLDAGINYNINFSSNVFYITSAPATPVTVTVTPNQTKVYGDPDPPAFTYTSSVSGVSFTGALTREPGEDAGVYAIVRGTLDAGEGYVINFVGANFEILRGPGAVIDAPEIVVEAVSYFSITVRDVVLSVGGEPIDHQAAEYAISTVNDLAGSDLGGLNWQGGVTFAGLDHGTVYYVYVRAAANANYGAGPAYVSGGVATLQYVSVTDIMVSFPESIVVGESFYLTGVAIPDSATYRSIVWSVRSSRSTGAYVIGDTLYTETAGVGPVTVRATVVNGLAPGVDFVKDFDIGVYRASFPPLPSSYRAGRITMGPNPVSRFGAVTFYNSGRRAASGTLYIYNALGVLVREVMIFEGDGVDEDARREIWTWDMHNSSGRRVGAGTYLVVGAVRYAEGGGDGVRILMGVAE